MILLPAIHVLFKNHSVFLLSDAPKFRNCGRQLKGVFSGCHIFAVFRLKKNKKICFISSTCTLSCNKSTMY